jgi:ActR/RegA family two-component response regulator
MEKILVVDDDEKWLETIDLILGDRYELFLTTDPSEAESKVSADHFSLAILDQRISSDISGIALLRRLRQTLPDLRGIILTGFAEVEDAVESMKVGAFDYISKGMQDLTSNLQMRVEKALKDKPLDEPVSVTIKRGESVGLEFKSSARWDLRLKRINHDLEAVVVRTVAAFLNSDGGGVLLMGVDDRGTVVGLQDDYKTLKKQDRDGFENFLVTLLLGAFGKDISPLIRIDFQEVEGSDVCRASTRPAPRAVFVADGSGGEHLFIRAGNSTRQLSTREAIEYCKTRWG